MTVARAGLETVRPRIAVEMKTQELIIKVNIGNIVLIVDEIRPGEPGCEDLLEIIINKGMLTV